MPNAFEHLSILVHFFVTDKNKSVNNWKKKKMVNYLYIYILVRNINLRNVVYIFWVVTVQHSNTFNGKICPIFFAN